MVVAPYGVDADVFRPGTESLAIRSRLGIRSDQPVIFTLGRMVYKKGFDVLVNAMPRVLGEHPTAVLVIGGVGDLQPALEQQVEQLGITAQVRFPGIVGRDEIAGYFDMASVAVFPSVHDRRGNVDGLPNVLLEAMSMGRPIVASRVAGIPQVIEDGKHGLLVPEGDAAALADATNRLLGSRSFAEQLGQTARARVARELRWSHIAARFETVYARAMSER
jgi:glycosyltransferase involved in cell wall biosynthesis